MPITKANVNKSTNVTAEHMQLTLTADHSSPTAPTQCDGFEHNEFCIMCRDGASATGTMFCCNECPRVTCQHCINIPDDIQHLVEAHDVTFKCIICHIGQQKGRKPKGPYFGFYRGEQPVLHKFLPILGNIEVSLKAEISCAPVLFLHLILVDFECSGSPFELAYHFIKPYFPQGGLHYEEMTFDVATELKAARYERQVKKLVKDLLLQPRWARVVIGITTHSDNTTGGQFAGYDNNKYVSGKVNQFLDLLLQPWKDIIDRADESYLWFFSCGGMVNNVDSFANLQKWLACHKITATVAFCAVAFHPNFASHLLLAFVELVLIERCPITIAFPHMLGQSNKLGRHTDIVFIHMKSPGGQLKVVKYSWGNADVRPWGQCLPIQCPGCGWVNAWQNVNAFFEIPSTCRIDDAGTGKNY